MKSPALLRSLCCLAAMISGGAFAQPTTTIPLQLVNIGTAQSPTYKLGIWVGLGGGAPKLYEFDTGGTGFFAAQFPAATANATNPNWWPADTYTVNATVGNFTATYSSGIAYDAQLVNTDVAIFASQNATAPVATVNAGVGQIVFADDSRKNNPAELNWTGYQQTPATTPPVWQHFYGDFGANLSPYTNNATGPGSFFVYGILPQLPGNLSSGFIIAMGGATTPSPTLQLGLTDADRATFPIQIPLLGPSLTPAPPPYPGSNRSTFNFFQAWGYASLSHKGAVQAFPTEVILDTGAPSMTIRTGTDLSIQPNFIKGAGPGGSLLDGVDFSFVAGSWNLAFTVSGNSVAEQVDVAPSVNAANLLGYINTGLNAFFAYDVMYDVQNGVIGFRAANPPTPAPPVVRISGPSPRKTTAARIRVSGTASAAAGLARVEYARESGGYRPANGRTNWAFTAPLAPGRNVFRVRAVAASGTPGPPARVVVIRR